MPFFFRFMCFVKRRFSWFILNLQVNSGVHGLLVSLRVSSYLHPVLHLFAILQNSTVRLEWINYLASGFLYLTNHFDKVRWVSLGFSTQSDSAQSKNLSRQAIPSSSSVLTLPRSFLLLSVFASFSPPFWRSWPRLKFWEQQSKMQWLADVSQMKKIFPLITCEMSSGQNVCEFMLGVM